MQNGLARKSGSFSKPPWNGNKKGDNNSHSTITGQQSGPAPGGRRGVLLMKKAMKWYAQRVVNVKGKREGAKESLSRDQITVLRSEALGLLKTDYIIYEEQKNSKQSDDHEWIRTVLSSGTVSDKLAAHTVLLQESPVHNLRSVESLLRFVNTKGKRECVMAIDNLRDLFIGDLLIPKEKLHTFEELVGAVEPKWLLTPGGKPGERERFLVISHVEDQIRSLYKKFIDALITVSHDSLEALKMKSLKTMFDLFVNNPEQEKYLLSCMINKLGDPTAKIASQTAHLLSQIISQHHPQMKLIVVKEVERLIFRPHISPRTEYYCLCFLSEMVFTAAVDTELANAMINIYFTVFNKCIKEGEINNRTMSTLLTGVSRAFPYSKLELDYLQKYLTTFYKILHYVNLNTGIQTLSLIFNLVNFNESGSLTDHFYSTLYRFIANPEVDHCAKSNLLLNLVYRSIKKDSVNKRVRAFVKRLFQVAILSSSAFVISILVLVSETLKTKTGFKLEANVLAGAGGNHTGEEHRPAPEADNGNKGDEDDDDDLEVYYDVDEDGKPRKPQKTSAASSGSWVYLKQQTAENTQKQQQQQPQQNDTTAVDGGQKPSTSKSVEHYDIDARNPQYCNADREELWELALISAHFHPTARLFAEQIRSGVPVEYDGNPLDDFTVKRFLDRFVFRNPKTSVKNTKAGETSVKTRVFGRREPGSKILGGVGEKELLEQPAAAVPADQQFIYRFLQQKKALKLKGRREGEAGDGDDSDIESVTSLEFNDLLDNYESYTQADEGGAEVEEIDFAKNYQQNSGGKEGKKGKKTKKGEDEDEIDDEDADFDEEFDEDDFGGDEDFMDDDEDDLMELSDDDPAEDGDFGEDDDDDDDDDFADLSDLNRGRKGANKARNAAPFAGKKGFSKITNDLFADAEEFSHILEQNEESDSDFDELEESGGGGGGAEGGKKSSKKGKNKKGDGGKKRKGGRPSLGRKAAMRRKKPRLSPDDL